MRILHTTHSYRPEFSGVSEVVSQISEQLARSGHEVHVATSRPRHSLHEAEINGVHVHRFRVHGNAQRGVTGDVQSYVDFVASNEWDVIALHCGQIWSTDVLLPRLVKQSAAIACVFHGLSRYADKSYAAYFRWLANHLKQIQSLVSLSTGLEDVRFCKEYGLPAPTVIPNGVDAERWATRRDSVREKWGIRNRPWIVCLSNHNPLKGHDRFVRVVRELRKANPALAGTLLGNNYLAERWGAGHFGVKGGCWYRCRAMSCLHEVDLRYDVGRDDVIAAVQECDVILCCSAWEASPLSILESMAAGTPWISFDVGCVREHVGGLVIRSEPEMVQAVQDLLTYPDKRTALGRQGQNRVAAEHTWASIASRYERLYTQVISAKGVTAEECVTDKRG